MNTSEEDCIELEARGIPRTKVHWPDDLDRTESIIMNLPPDLDLALREMKSGKVITLEEFKKEFKEWRERIIRMSGFNMVAGVSDSAAPYSNVCAGTSGTSPSHPERTAIRQSAQRYDI